MCRSAWSCILFWNLLLILVQLLTILKNPRKDLRITDIWSVIGILFVIQGSVIHGIHSCWIRIRDPNPFFFEDVTHSCYFLNDPWEPFSLPSFEESVVKGTYSNFYTIWNRIAFGHWIICISTTWGCKAIRWTYVQRFQGLASKFSPAENAGWMAPGKFLDSLLLLGSIFFSI